MPGPAQPRPPAAPISAEDARDIEIVRAIRDSRPGAWEALIGRYQDRLFAVCVRMVRDRDLAEDLTQDAFLKLIQGLDKYDGRSKFSTWAIRVTMNVCLSRLRSEKLRRHASLDLATAGEDGPDGPLSSRQRQVREPEPAAGVQQSEGRQLVLRALQLLEPDQRAVLILRDQRGLEYEQIAEVLGVAVGTIKSRLFRARAALRQEIENIGGEA